MSNTDKGKGKRERIVIEWSPACSEILKELKLRSGAGTNAETIRNLARFIAALLDERDAGMKVLLQSPSGEIFSGEPLMRILGVPKKEVGKENGENERSDRNAS